MTNDLRKQQHYRIVRCNDNSAVTLASTCHGVEAVGSAQPFAGHVPKRNA